MHTQVDSEESLWKSYSHGHLCNQSACIKHETVQDFLTSIYVHVALLLLVVNTEHIQSWCPFRPAESRQSHKEAATVCSSSHSKWQFLGHNTWTYLKKLCHTCCIFTHQSDKRANFCIGVVLVAIHPFTSILVSTNSWRSYLSLKLQPLYAPSSR